MTALTIDVTAADIANGDIESVTNCPIGLAMQRAVGHPEISVDRQYIINKRTGERAVVRRSKTADHIVESTPPEAVAFQTAIIEGRPVRPFSFTVNMELP